MRAVDELELLVRLSSPLRALGAFVLAVADLGGGTAESVGRRPRVEDELDHLPVALVRVVPVVEDVVEPVLESELARVTGIRGHVRVDRRLRPPRETLTPAFVVAAGI